MSTNESDHSEIIEIIEYNQVIRNIVQDQTKEFLILKNTLIENLNQEKINENPVVENNETFFNTKQIELLNEQVTSSKIQLALVGTNSCGKTSFLHYLLRSANFLPTDVGPVSARIVRLTYAEAEDAVLYVYKSIYHKKCCEQVSLKEFFLYPDEPDWNGIKSAIKIYVARPDPENLKSHSNEFVEWAKYFVEIRIPSSFLKLGIDLYDTPGLLFSDAPILKHNLCQLVISVKPTLVFMYDNAAVNSDTRDCFLALKNAIGHLTESSIFFLNTKVDIDRILDDADPNNQGIDDDQLPDILLNERQKRYEFLLKVPSMVSEFSEGLPQSVLECSCFDIISVHSDLDEFGGKLNQTTVKRLIQFTANSDLRTAKIVSKLVLPMIDAFFDLALTTNHRTVQQFKHILDEASKWTESYYLKYRKLIEELLIELYNNIVEQLQTQSKEIAERAARYDSNVAIENYIKTAVQQDVIKTEIENIKKKYLDIKFLDQLTDPSLIKIAQKNEFLIAAQRNLNWLFESKKTSLDKKSTRQIFDEQTVLAQILLITDTLIESDDKNKRIASLSNYKQLFTKRVSLGRDINSSELAKERVAEFLSWLINQETYINEIVNTGYAIEKNNFIKKIYQFYQLAIDTVDKREKLYKVVTKYSYDFAAVQCKILSALNLAKFNGQIPTIDQTLSIDEQIYLAMWDNNEFLIKKTLEYLEVHYHLRIVQLDIPNILPLLHLYEDEKTNHIWMFFSNYSRTFKDIHFTVDRLFEISYDIANTLVHLHLNEIVHGSIRIENIYFDATDQCYLANFYFNKQEQVDMTRDIHAYGKLIKYLYEHLMEIEKNISEEDLKNLGELKTLFTQCLNSSISKRPKAVEIVEQIKKIRKNL